MAREKYCSVCDTKIDDDEFKRRWGYATTTTSTWRTIGMMRMRTGTTTNGQRGEVGGAMRKSRLCKTCKKQMTITTACGVRGLLLSKGVSSAIAHQVTPLCRKCAKHWLQTRGKRLRCS